MHVNLTSNKHSTTSSRNSKQKHVSAIDGVIGLKITEIRASLGITRQDLANKLGITHQQLQKYEKGKNRITVSRFLEICKYLNVSSNYFLNEEVNEEKTNPIKSQRLMVQTMRDFAKIKNEEKKVILRKLIKVMGEEKTEEF